jgi:small subunit ribosomal protein S8
MTTDPIADMIIRVKNAAMAGRETVSVPMSNMKLAIAEKLKQRGLFADVATHGKHVEKSIEITFAKDEGGAFRFSDVRRVSKPGCRVYMSAGDIKPVRGGSGALVISTPKGIMFGEEARKQHVGGEALFEIW